jgi:hypothetical protein
MVFEAGGSRGMAAWKVEVLSFFLASLTAIMSQGSASNLFEFPDAALVLYAALRRRSSTQRHLAFNDWPLSVRQQAPHILQSKLAICRGDMFCLQQSGVWPLFVLFAMMMQQLFRMWGKRACTRGRKRFQHARERGCRTRNDDSPGLSTLWYAPLHCRMGMRTRKEALRAALRWNGIQLLPSVVAQDPPLAPLLRVSVTWPAPRHHRCTVVRDTR